RTPSRSFDGQRAQWPCRSLHAWLGWRADGGIECNTIRVPLSGAARRLEESGVCRIRDSRWRSLLLRCGDRADRPHAERSTHMTNATVNALVLSDQEGTYYL